MKKYKVFIHGCNFLMNLEGQKKYGFYTTRFVEAENETEAEGKTIEMLRNDPKFRNNVLNSKSDTPMIYVEEITELDSFDGVNVPGTGYTFYPEDGKDDEENDYRLVKWL